MTEAVHKARRLCEIGDFRAALVELIEGSRRELCIFSAQLAHPLYHDKDVVDALSAFCRSSRFANVRVLVRDTEPMQRRFHRVHQLLQRLSSRIELRKIQATLDTPDWEFALGDCRSLLVCEDRDRWRGLFEPESAVRGRKLMAAFEQEWPLAAPVPNLRRLQL